MADSLVMSPVRCSVKSKYASLRVKSCSPKFKIVLREKYKERVKNSRMKLLDYYRNNSCGANVTNIQEFADCDALDSEICKIQELESLLNTDDFNLDEELMYEDVVNEELTQFENWLFKEYESMWSEESNDEVIITCPLCCSGQFERFPSDNMIYCRHCNSSFSTQRSMLDIQNDIFNEVDNHKIQCSSNPGFVKVPGDEFHTNLCIVCDVCGYLQVII